MNDNFLELKNKLAIAVLNCLQENGYTEITENRKSRSILAKDDSDSTVAINGRMLFDFIESKSIKGNIDSCKNRITTQTTLIDGTTTKILLEEYQKGNRYVVYDWKNFTVTYKETLDGVNEDNLLGEIDRLLYRGKNRYFSLKTLGDFIKILKKLSGAFTGVDLDNHSIRWRSKKHGGFIIHFQLIYKPKGTKDKFLIADFGFMGNDPHKFAKSIFREIAFDWCLDLEKIPEMARTKKISDKDKDKAIKEIESAIKVKGSGDN